MKESSSKPDLSRLQIERAAETQPRSGTGTRHWMWIIPVVVVLVAILYLALRGGGSDVVVQTATVARFSPAAGQSLLTATGYVVAQRKAAVASKGTGRLEILNVEEGDRVMANDVIGQLESDDVEAAQAAARAAVDQAEANLHRAEAVQHEAGLNFDRIKSLHANDLAAQSVFDNAEALYLTAKAGTAAAGAALRRARADLRWAEVQVENTYIRAPFDGTVLTKYADVGEVVAPFAASASSRGALVTLADMTSLEVEADVSESNIRKITIGQPCLITLDALPAEPYGGSVKKIVPTADRAKATVLTKIAFDQLDDRVLPEMSAKVNFLPAESSGESVSTETFLAVPATAITTRGGGTVVFRIRNYVVEAVSVEPGAAQGNATRINGSLQPGDLIVVSPPEDLTDGDRITLEQ